MKVFEIFLAVVFLGMGIRSVIYWIRRPFETSDLRDNVLYALFVTGRVGLWFALSGLFALYASIDTQGRAFTDDAAQYRWLLPVLAALAGLQLVAGFFLGRRTSR